MTKAIKTYIILSITSLFLISCVQENRNVAFFQETQVYNLAKAVERSDLAEIEKIVNEKPELLNVANPISGSNVLSLSLTLENYASFRKLLELGANPNFINPITRKSPLIEACKFYSKPEPYTIDLKFIELLLDKKANVNYTIESDFTDKKGHYHIATSPLMEASKLDVEMVKMLINHGADPHKKLHQNMSTPFASSLDGFKNKFEIINYYIDSLKVDINAPIYVGKKDTLFIQDYIKKYFSYKIGTEGHRNTETLVKKLQQKGINFEN